MSTVPVLLGALAALACLARARTLGRHGPAAVETSLAGPPSTPPTRVATWWATTLDDLGIEGDPVRTARAVAGALVVLAAVVGWRGGPAGAVVAVAVVLVAAAVARQAGRGRGARRADARLPDLVEHVGRGLRAGHDLRGAVLAASGAVGGPHGAALVGVAAQVDGGARWDDALDAWAEDHPRRPIRLVGGALAVCEAAGGRAAPALDGVAATLRARAAVADEARALASQAQASAAVLIALPAVVAIGGAVADPKVADALLGTPWGLGCIALAALLDGTGALWMHRIVTGSTS